MQDPETGVAVPRPFQSIQYCLKLQHTKRKVQSILCILGNGLSVYLPSDITAAQPTNRGPSTPKLAVILVSHKAVKRHPNTP